MIKKYFPGANIKNDFEPSGLVSLIQNAKDHDILFLNVTNPSKVDEFLRDNLISSFAGLVVATNETNEVKKHNHVILDKLAFESKLQEMMDVFYPEKKTKYLGVTGTNGKTTTCWLISELCKVQKKNILYIGTIGIFFNGDKVSDEFVTTTPTLLDLRKIMFNIKECIDVVALEISSHALMQNRLKSLKLHGAAWTNFTQDHLDYHKTMDEYFAAKSKIVEMLHENAYLYINAEEEKLFHMVTTEKKQKVKPFTYNDEKSIPLFLKSGFNIKNLSLACALLNIKDLVGLDELCPPPGRFEVIKKNQVNFIVDYAHTPDALKSVLLEIKTSYPGFYIITVVGCGGDRDKTKRPLMAKESCEYSNLSIFTSDNPRSENPITIIEDMIDGTLDEFEVEADRKKAITLAMNKAKKRSEEVIVLVAGKGHETYQEVNGVRHHFSDAEVIKSL